MRIQKQYAVGFWLAALLLGGCAKGVPEFVPISLNWYEFEGNVQLVDSVYRSAALDSLQEERCQISLTRSLMENKSVQSLPDDRREFDVQFFGRESSGRILAEFRGKCREALDSTDFEQFPLPFSTASGCSFTAQCDEKGTLEKLRIF